MGASGDLAPLAHLAAGLMGDGRMWSPITGWGLASDVLQQNGLEPIEYKSKEVRTNLRCSFWKISLGFNNDQWNAIYNCIRC